MPVSKHRRHNSLRLGIIAGLTIGALAAAGPSEARTRLEFDRLAPSFVGEVRNATGTLLGTGFASANKWGEYTAYIMLTDSKGRRTWRIENLQSQPGTGTAAGSTMYLFEGSKRALLIDTANPATATEGVNDLKTVVKFLLGHDNTGKPKRNPLDFVVANTHSHGDHTGENARMSDRTVFYMDGDWPNNAPPNYVPIKEGGGPTSHGKGAAVGEIDLGGRVLKAIDVPPHTDGSVAYLDAENQLLVSGDALGSAWPFLQRGPISRFVQTTKHLIDVTAPYPDLVVLPAHFYQVSYLDRATLTRDEQILNRRYITDIAALAEEIVDGRAIGAPFSRSSRDYWAVRGTAKIVYTLDAIGRPGEVLPSNYHVVGIPGGPPAPREGQALNVIRDMAANTYLIRGPNGESLFLLRGSKRALLIGAGSGAPGLSAAVARLTAGVPLDVAVLDGDRSQTGGLAQLSPETVFVAAGSALRDPRQKILNNGDIIDLGLANDGAPLRLEAQSLAIPGKPSMTLFSRGDRALFIGTALGAMTPGAPLEVSDPLAFQQALSDWAGRAGGRARILYASPSPAWFTDPGYIDQLQQTLSRANSGRGPGRVSDANQQGNVTITAEPAAAAAVIMPRSRLHP